jgi:membrane protein required for colicin V production
LNTFDIVIFGILIFAAYKGFQKGFVLEIIAIISFVLAIIGGFKLMHWGMDLLDQHFDISGELLPYLSFIVIFIGIILIVNLVGKAFKKIIDLTPLGAVDNIVGAALSIIKWSFGISILLWLSDSFGLAFSAEWTDDSLIYSHLLSFAPMVVDYASGVMPFAHDLFDQIQKMLSGDPTP